jgi:hypothetical protein
MLQTTTILPRPAPTRRLRNIVVLLFLLVFLLPVIVRASLYLAGNRPLSWRDANWSSSGMLPAASAYPPARVLVLSGRAGGLKGVVALHSWIVVKQANARAWTRYDVAGWGDPVKINNWAPDGRWYGSMPAVVVDVSGAQAEALIPRIDAAVKDYQYDHAGDYRVWPGPNSNTFTATVLRAVPELRAELPPNAIGRDFRSLPYAGLTGSGTGIELNLWGLIGLKLGLVEGIEVNLLGLVAGIDFLHPALKLPAFGLIGLPHASASAAR